MYVFEVLIKLIMILIGIFFWPLQMLFWLFELLLTKTVILSLLFIFVVFVILALIFHSPVDQSDGKRHTSKKEPKGLSAGGYMFIGWAVYQLFESSSSSSDDTEDEAEAKTKTKAKPKAKAKAKAKTKLKAKALTQPKQATDAETEPPQASTPELNLGALSSLLLKEVKRPEDEQGERLTVKKGLEALGGVDAIDAYLSKKDPKKNTP